MSTLRMRIHSLLQHLQRGIYEKNTETSLALLAALAGESILLLGPPGVAKSMVARRLKLAFKDASSFEYLMSRFSTPDEIFGPVSISSLKKSDTYVRAVKGYLPTADVVFLDEIWKAGPAIQNTLLTIMNEKLFRNGNEEMHLPLKLLVAASNELPAKGEGLEALWDRFIVRIVCKGIADEHTFRQMLCEDQVEEVSVDNLLAVTNQEYNQWQAEAKTVKLSTELLDAIEQIRIRLRKVDIENSELPRSIYVSDRRWKHIVRLLQMSAYIQGRHEVLATDLLPLYHCMWNETEEINAVRRIVINAVLAPYVAALQRISQAVQADLKARSAKEALVKALRDNDHRDDNLAIVSRYFYQVAGHGTGHTCVFITDFKRMPIHGKFASMAPGVMYKDPTNAKRTIVRLYSPEIAPSIPDNCEQVTLCRDDDHIYINGTAFKMRIQGDAVLNPSAGKVGKGLFSEVESTNNEEVSPSAAHYEEDIEHFCDSVDTLQRTYKDNMFVADADTSLLDTQLQQIYKQVALCRVDIRKLLYDE